MFRRRRRSVTRDIPQGPGRPLVLDAHARSADPSLPAFLARPPEAPIYHGFAIVDDIEVEGFRLGMITDFVSGPEACGDAFLIAPDDSRAGLVWGAEVEVPYLEQVLPPDDTRWGVWSVGLREPLRSKGDAEAYLAALVVLLRPHWLSWCDRNRESPSGGDS